MRVYRPVSGFNHIHGPPESPGQVYLSPPAKPKEKYFKLAYIS